MGLTLLRMMMNKPRLDIVSHRQSSGKREKTPPLPDN